MTSPESEFEDLKGQGMSTPEYTKSPAPPTMMEPGSSSKRVQVEKTSSSSASVEDKVEGPMEGPTSTDPAGPNEEGGDRGGVRGGMLVVAILLVFVAAFYTPQSADSGKDADAKREEWFADVLEKMNLTMWEMHGGSGGLMLSREAVIKAASHISKAMTQLQLSKIKAKYREQIQDFLKELSMLVESYKVFNDWAEDVMMAERSVADLLVDKLPELYNAMQSRNEEMRKYLVEILTARLDTLEEKIGKLVTSHKGIQRRTENLNIDVEIFRKAREESASKNEEGMIDNFTKAVGVASATATLVVFSPLFIAGAAAVPVVNTALTSVGITMMKTSIASTGAFLTMREGIEAYKLRTSIHNERLVAELVGHFEDGMDDVVKEMRRRTLTLRDLRDAAAQTKDRVTRTTTTKNKEMIRMHMNEISSSAQKLSKLYTHILGSGAPGKLPKDDVMPAHNYYV